MNEREAFKNPHALTCTCVDCTQRRLRRRQGLWQRFKSLVRGRR